MEQIPFILMTVLTAAAYCAYFWTERKLYDNEIRHRVIRERESIAARMLYGYCQRLFADTEQKYIDKDDVLRHLIAVVNVQGYDPRRENPPKESKDESPASCLLSPDSSAGGR